MRSSKRLICLILVLVCLLSTLPVTRAAEPVETAEATEAVELPAELYLTQEESGTCTLCSAAMMIRSCMYRNGDHGWTAATESALKKTAWLNSVGLKWNFTYTTENSTVRVGHKGVDGFTAEELKALLDEHPEGIVLYCSRIPHAVFLIGYEGDTFYCAETVKGYSGEKITLEESWLGTKYGTQDNVLANVTAYWYVAEYEDSHGNVTCGCQEFYAGTYVCTTTSAALLIRKGHGTGYSVVGKIPAGATVTVTRATGAGDNDWAHVSYNGVSGYSSMKYLSQVTSAHEFETTVVAPSCENGGYTVHACKGCGYSHKEAFTDPAGHSYGDWTASDVSGEEIRTCTGCGTTETRTVSTSVMGTVTGNELRIRSGAGTSYSVVGFLMKGHRVEILEQKTVGSAVWGRIEKGWISMAYVNLDKTEETPEEPPVTEPPVTEPPVTEPPVTEPPATEPEETALMGTVTGNELRIRSGAGTSYSVVGFLMKGHRVEILEMTTVNGMSWGRIEKGWISLGYVELDETQPEPEAPETKIMTVNTSCLRVRSEATTASTIVGFLYRGAKVEILETKTVGGMTWGRITNGWISMDYVI